jgi:hypothetical protein
VGITLLAGKAEWSTGLSPIVIDQDARERKEGFGGDGWSSVEIGAEIDRNGMVIGRLFCGRDLTKNLTEKMIFYLSWSYS